MLKADETGNKWNYCNVYAQKQAIFLYVGDNGNSTIRCSKYLWMGVEWFFLEE